jgi:hypothetical protein
MFVRRIDFNLCVRRKTQKVMRKNYFIVAGALAGAAFLLGPAARSNSGGSPAGYSGSPASNGQTCRSCHTGPATGPQIISITTDIPPTGFDPNTTYTINVRAEANGGQMTRVGFMASIEDDGGVHQGSLSAFPEVQRVGGGNFMTHRSTSTQPIGGARNYSFEWNSGNSEDSISIYTAVNFANGDGGTSGDIIKTQSLLLRKNLTFSAENLAVADLKVMPNPVVDFVRVQMYVRSNESGSVQVLDLSGRVVANLVSGRIPAGYYNETFDLSHLSTGIYHLVVTSGTQKFTERLLVR